MSKLKPTFWMLGLVAAGFLMVDWSRLVLRPTDMSASPWSNALKVCFVFLVTTLAYRLGDKRLRVIFSIILCADICFALGQPPIGILLFAGVHVLLAKRNLIGIKSANLQRGLPLVATISAVALAVIVAAVIWIYTMQGVTPLLVVIGIYTLMLWVSVTAAWLSRLTGTCPARNALSMAVGLTLFELCDVNVAANLVLANGSLPRVITESVTWMFYAPALVCIVLASFKSLPEEEKIALASAPFPS
jgi:hypothetical protein